MFKTKREKVKIIIFASVVVIGFNLVTNIIDKTKENIATNVRDTYYKEKELNEIKENLKEINKKLDSLSLDKKGSRIVITSNNRGYREIIDFENMDLREKSNLKENYIELILKGTDLEGYSNDFLYAEEVYGVNALFLLSLAIHESGWGNSRLAKEKNNIFGFAAHDKDPFNSATEFDSKRECILKAAQFIKNNYLKEDGKYFSGYTIKDINEKYASDKEWYKKIVSIMNYIHNKVINNY